MEVILSKKKDIVFRTEEKINTDKIKVIQVTDNYSSVIALLSIGGGELDRTMSLTLWAEADYEAIGQWTDTDVETRLKELL